MFCDLPDSESVENGSGVAKNWIGKEEAWIPCISTCCCAQWCARMRLHGFRGSPSVHLCSVSTGTISRALFVIHPHTQPPRPSCAAAAEHPYLPTDSRAGPSWQNGRVPTLPRQHLAGSCGRTSSCGHHAAHNFPVVRRNYASRAHY